MNHATCIHCGETFESEFTRKYCSAYCRRAAWKVKNGANPMQNEISCSECGSRFRGHGNRKYCSRNCARRAANRLREEWFRANPDKPSAIFAYPQTDEQRLARYLANRAYYENNRADYAARWHLRRARIARAKNFRFSEHDLARLLRRQDGRCLYCHAPLEEKHLDHVVPLARGGDHGISNFAWACPPCNWSKGSRTVMEWRVAGRIK